MPTRRSRTTSIRRSLLGNLVVLVALTSGAIVLVTWIAGDRTVEAFSRLLLEPTARRTEAQLDRFFGDVRAQTLIGRGWTERGMLDPTDHEALNRIFVPVLEAHPHLSSMMVADSTGTEYLLLRDALEPTVWHNRIVRADHWGTRVLNRRWDTATGDLEESFGELDYDPRRRIWYQEALETDADEPIAWSEPVIFFITKDPGITASTHVEVPDDEHGTRTVVVAFDLLLLDVSRFTSSLEVSEHGRAFVLVEEAGSNELRVVGLPRDDHLVDDRALREALIRTPPAVIRPDEHAVLPTAGELETPGVAASVEAWDDAGRPWHPLGYERGGERWIAGLRPYTLGRNTFWIGVTLPEHDLVGGIAAQRLALLGLLAVIVGIGVVRAILVARRLGRPVEALVRETERIRGGDLEPGEPIETNVIEFRRLARAQDHMREDLRARLRLEKLERDLDLARDIQRGLLPTEAPDTPGFVVEGWSQPADQTGGDYFDWMTLPDGRTLVTLADVTGHGIGPALIVSVFRAYIRAAALGLEQALARSIERVNELLLQDLPAERFVTAVIGVLDPAAHELRMIAAGHGPVVFHRAATSRTEAWPADTLPLGIASGLSLGSPRCVRFEPGDVLVVVTDGFFEWANEAGEQYGTTRLVEFVQQHADRGPAELIAELHRSVLAHAASTEQTDDLTAIVIRRLGDEADATFAVAGTGASSSAAVSGA